MLLLSLPCQLRTKTIHNQILAPLCTYLVYYLIFADLLNIKPDLLGTKISDFFPLLLIGFSFIMLLRVS